MAAAVAGCREAQSSIFGVRTMKERRLDEQRILQAANIPTNPHRKERELLQACGKNAYQKALALTAMAPLQVGWGFEFFFSLICFFVKAIGMLMLVGGRVRAEALKAVAAAMLAGNLGTCLLHWGRLQGRRFIGTIIMYLEAQAAGVSETALGCAYENFGSDTLRLQGVYEKWWQRYSEAPGCV